MDVQNLTSLLSIAEKAIAAQDAEAHRKAEQADLTEAYAAWKAKHGIERVERDTLDWTRMMVATKPRFDRVEQAKREERNAKRRLATAITRYHREGGAA